MYIITSFYKITFKPKIAHQIQSITANITTIGNDNLEI